MMFLIPLARILGGFSVRVTSDTQSPAPAPTAIRVLARTQMSLLLQCCIGHRNYSNTTSTRLVDDDVDVDYLALPFCYRAAPSA
jgi:hypothetical protein